MIYIAKLSLSNISPSGKLKNEQRASLTRAGAVILLRSIADIVDADTLIS